MAKRILSRQDPPEKCCITRSDLDALYSTWYALNSAIELAGKDDNPLKDIAAVCARDMGRILDDIDRRYPEGGR